nr:uncharacterized protein LOC106836232 [Equus asinus]
MEMSHIFTVVVVTWSYPLHIRAPWSTRVLASTCRGQEVFSIVRSQDGAPWGRGLEAAFPYSPASESTNVLFISQIPGPPPESGTPNVPGPGAGLRFHHWQTRQRRLRSAQGRRPYACSSFIWSPPCPRAHSLHYNLTVVSQDGSVQSGFFAEGQLDGQPFLSYDSEKSRAEPQGLWAEAVLGAETWDAEAEDLMEKGKDLKMTLADVMALQDQKGDPWMDSIPVLTSNPGDGDQESWDTDNFQSKDYRAHVQGELCQRLWRYLESWMGFRERTGKAPVQQSGWPTILLVAAVVGIVSAIIPCALWYKKKRRTTLPAEIPESTVLHGDRHHQGQAPGLSPPAKRYGLVGKLLTSKVMSSLLSASSLKTKDRLVGKLRQARPYAPPPLPKTPNKNLFF